MDSLVAAPEEPILSPPMSERFHHNVYAVLLDKAVLKERKVAASNPNAATDEQRLPALSSNALLPGVNYVPENSNRIRDSWFAVNLAAGAGST